MLVGVVGKPSAGKSTFFKAATMVDVAIANYAFTTIKPNHAVGYVKIQCVCKDFNTQCNPRSGWCVKGQRYVPIELLDVAGLVPGAHKGEGMGLQFMSDLNQADALIHIIDISGSVDEKGNSVDTLSYDPLNDVEFLEKELDHWYLEILKRGWERFSRSIHHEGKEPYKEIAKQLSGLGANDDLVKNALNKLNLDQNKISQWGEEELYSLAKEMRIKTKPMLIAANKIDKEGAEKNYNRLKEKYPDYKVIPCSGDYEVILRTLAKKDIINYNPGDSEFNILLPDKLNESQKNALEKIKSFLNTFGSTGVQELLNISVLGLLRYKAVFPGGVSKLEDKHGNVLPDCFLLPEKATALDFAYRIHKDIGEGFVKAIDVKTKRILGRDHLLKHRDVIEIKTTG